MADRRPADLKSLPWDDRARRDVPVTATFTWDGRPWDLAEAGRSSTGCGASHEAQAAAKLVDAGWADHARDGCRTLRAWDAQARQRHLIEQPTDGVWPGTAPPAATVRMAAASSSTRPR